MTTEAPRAPSYWESVWAELIRRPLPRLGLHALGGLLAIAVAAPLLSSNQPLYWNAGDGPRFPLASALLNRLYFENAVDLYFNLALLLAPLALVLLLAAHRRGAGATRRTARVLLAAHAVAFALSAPSSYGPIPNPLRHSAAVVNYRLEAERLRA
ncbi:MAG: hypothetical protein FJ104_05725, partial [Deltaproteobacteria bacterium]|nr:hypothetical protein [Deltaproteobacteria bacterium]